MLLRTSMIVRILREPPDKAGDVSRLGGEGSERGGFEDERAVAEDCRHFFSARGSAGGEVAAVVSESREPKKPRKTVDARRTSQAVDRASASLPPPRVQFARCRRLNPKRERGAQQEIATQSSHC
jgi:hypothetical protein